MPVRSGRDAQRKVSARQVRPERTEVTRAARETADGQWLVRGKDGRLAAYALGDGELLRWTETRPAGPDWTGPEVFPATGLTDLTVHQGRDGFVRFVARRTTRRAEGDTVDLVHATQFQSGRPVTAWHSLGNPHRDREQGVRVGVPTVGTGADGLLHVLVRDADGRLLLRREQDGGKWTGWTALGKGLGDGAVLATTEAGRIEILAPLVPGTAGAPAGGCPAKRWSQKQPGGELTEDHEIPFGHVPGTAVALETTPDVLTYYWADVGTGGIFAHRPGSWVIPLDSSPVTGRPAVLRAPLDGYDCTVLAHRGADGGIMLTACGTENEGAGVWWSPTGEHSAGAPALAHDADGRVVLALIDRDGALRIARQRPEPGLAMEPATPVRHTG
ncbi:hypothetical protein [Streptomyces sp. NBC_00102]|uniref:hypothetical protein n=1 Tax=Streptomyces sp. NBC_00102 TaxID=2975652 RepID=UPI002252431C|nr:hypothetical protein [Streptomyces sp. NBC_00102]MCX5400514.1 hypothetical protein [Streptomyces sp. NBC_00102]